MSRQRPSRLTMVSLLLLLKLSNKREFEDALRKINESSDSINTDIAYLSNGGYLEIVEDDGLITLRQTTKGKTTVALWRDMNYKKFVSVLKVGQIKKLLACIMQEAFNREAIDMFKVISLSLPIETLRAFNYALEDAIDNHPDFQ